MTAARIAGVLAFALLFGAQGAATAAPKAGVPVPGARPDADTAAAKPERGKQPDRKSVGASAPAAAEPKAEDDAATGASAGEPDSPAPPPAETVPVPEARPTPPAASAPEPATPSEQKAAPERKQSPTDAAVPPGQEDEEGPAPETEESQQPKPRTPEELRGAAVPIAPEDAVKAAAAVEAAKQCESALKERGVKFSVGESISEGDCGVLRPITLETLSSGVAVTPDTQILCPVALALDEWVSRSVIPEAKADLDGAKLTTIRHASTYVCRSRVGAGEHKISEHARGDAVDIAEFGFEGGRSVGIKEQGAGSAEEKFQGAVRQAACGPFKTVLGPGTNAAHATHFHLDLAARRNGFTYCK